MPSIKRESTKEMGNQNKGESWSKTSRIPLTIPEAIFMMKEMVKEGRNGFQLSKVRMTPSIKASSRSTMISARMPKIRSR
jgi:hypothetical protein